MKHIFFVILVTVLLCTFTSCGGGSKSGKPSKEEIFDKEGSYALGMNMGTNLKQDGIYPDVKEFIKGMEDVLYGAEPRYSMEEAYQVFTDAFNAFREKREAAKMQEELSFLEENGKKPGITVTESGLQYEIITKGEGNIPSISDVVRVHYEGTLVDGTGFDSSYSRGEPAEFSLGGVIPGWTEGLQLMNVGSKYRFFIPSNLGYGPQGAGPQIPPYSTLIFEVELIDIVR